MTFNPHSNTVLILIAPTILWVPPFLALEGCKMIDQMGLWSEVPTFDGIAVRFSVEVCVQACFFAVACNSLGPTFRDWGFAPIRTDRPTTVV